MIHPYDEYYLNDIQEKMGNIFECALLFEHLNLDDFVELLINSKDIALIQRGDLIRSLGLSSAEILARILNQEPKEYSQNDYGSAEYWTGYVTAYITWYFNISYKELNNLYPIKKIYENYLPYHEMDIKQLVDEVSKYIPIKKTIKELRLKLKYSQSQLATLSNVPIRNIRLYEQKPSTIRKASVETIYRLAKVLHVSIEELIV